MHAPQLTLRRLRYFVAVADNESLTAAAEALHVSQPSLSVAISDLESTFEVQLIVRHHAKGVSLTPAGAEIARHARQLLDHAEELESRIVQLGSSAGGPLDIGCFTTVAPFLLPQLVRKLAALHPAISPVLREGKQDEVQGDLLHGKTEIAILYDLDISDLIDCHTLMRLPPYVLVSPEHPLAGRKSASLTELADLPMVLLDTPGNHNYFVTLFEQAGLEPKIAHRSTSYEMIRSMVANGFGYSILNLQPANSRDYDENELLSIGIEEQPKALSLVVATLKEGRLTERARIFRQFCIDEFASRGR